jgi:hypothetical protein
MGRPATSPTLIRHAWLKVKMHTKPLQCRVSDLCWGMGCYETVTLTVMVSRTSWVVLFALLCPHRASGDRNRNGIYRKPSGTMLSVCSWSMPICELAAYIAHVLQKCTWLSIRVSWLFILQDAACSGNLALLFTGGIDVNLTKALFLAFPVSAKQRWAEIFRDKSRERDISCRELMTYHTCHISQHCRLV